MSGASKTKMAGVAAINVELFRHRLKLFYEQWKVRSMYDVEKG
jgi:hypothetical protein